MKHPDREEWVPFIFGEATGETRKRLAQHLESCPDCARDVAAWRRTVGRLDKWRLPKARAKVEAFAQPVFKLAWAMAVALAAGLIIGRISAPRPVNAAELRAAVETSVRASLQAEMRSALEESAVQTSNLVKASEARLAQASDLESQQLWRAVADTLRNTRSEDARAVQALFRRYQKQHDGEFVALRKDLETLASMTDEELRQAQFKLIQLAANNSTQE